MTPADGATGGLAPSAEPHIDDALDPHLKLVLQAAAAREGPDLIDLPLPVMRQVFRDMKVGVPVSQGLALAEVRELQVDGAAGPIGARLYVPVDAEQPGPGLVYFHGGGFVVGDLETHDDFLRRLAARSGVRVLAVDYRLAPEHPFPAPHDDALAATIWALTHLDELGFDGARIAVGGDSAGGNLAASVALDLRGSALGAIAFQLLLYPVTQWRDETDSMRKFGEGYFLTKRGMDFFQASLFGGTSRIGDPRLEVLHAPDLQGAPKALVVTAGYDPLKDEGAAYARALEAAGVEVDHIDHPGMIHGFYGMGGVSPGALKALDETAEALAAGLR